MENYGYFKVASATIEVAIGDPHANRIAIQTALRDLDPGVRLVAFPELCMSGYTCGDLFYQTLLLEEVEQEVFQLIKENNSEAILVVGLPLRQGNHLFNCAAYLYKHDILGIAIKSFLPNYDEFYEKRWFSDAAQRSQDTIVLQGKTIPFTPNLILYDETSGAKISTEICEDLWVAFPPSSQHCLAGTNVIVNLSASNETIGKKEYRRSMLLSQSTKCICGYVYSSADVSESTTDMVFSAHLMIADHGHLLAERTFLDTQKMIFGEIDLEKLLSDRLKYSTYMQSKVSENYTIVKLTTRPVLGAFTLLRPIAAYPFVPQDKDNCASRCQEILTMQAAALSQRLKKIACRKLVIGISGGLDSTLALIAAKKAIALCGYPATNILAVTMPGFATSTRTYENANKLIEAMQVHPIEIDIQQAVLQHYADIQHDPKQYDVTYENAQARERTQILMDLANQQEALVVGTGDMSELALGWCTYNGDHMSMYAINASIPKTLVRFLVSTYAQEMQTEGKLALYEVLTDICATPVSPELLPGAKHGEIGQLTEQSLGSYDYHDFFLYHMLRNAYRPKKIYALACIAFPQVDRNELKHTMKLFYHRFFTQQFKRSALPDGVKIGSVCLSPRSDWRMPSDASAALWLQEVEAI